MAYSIIVTSQKFLSLGSVLLLAAFLFLLSYFKVQDSDFWWHVKAGEILLQSGWIHTDPFAYTREGLPYVATHEWLAQIVLYGVFNTFGAAGIVVLRWGCALIISGLILSLDRRRIWPNAFLVAAGFVFVRHGLIERPQIFSNVLFAFSVFSTFVLLERRDSTSRWVVGTLLTLAQILWVNLHGGAAFLALIVPGTLFIQMLVERRSMRDLAFPVILCVSLLAAMLVSPNGFHNLTYVWLLFSDKTAEFIKEWSPQPWGQYVVQFGWLWIAVLAALMAGRRNIIASALVLLSTGVLSRMGARHEPLFLVAALSVTVYQLSFSRSWQDLLDRRVGRTVPLAVATFLLVVLVLGIDAPYRTFLKRTNRFGIGTVEAGKGAYEFIVSQDIRGPVFNTYALGGYLLYRGAPDRRVFIDGRNVDYGYDFLKKALDARYEVKAFTDLSDTYDFTHAVIEYTADTQDGSALDFAFMKDLPDWALVYIDDRVAVYARRTLELQPLIAEREYRLLTPEGLLRQTALQFLTPENRGVLVGELLRAAKDTEKGISAIVLLSLAQSSMGELRTAVALVDEAMRRAPNRYEPYLAGAIAFESAGQWKDAAAMYEEADERARSSGASLRYDRIADVFDKIGETEKADEYRRRAAAQR